MFPHADTIYTINALDYPQRLRQAANQRLAASAQTSVRSRPSTWESARLIAASWLTRVLRGASGTKRLQGSLPMASTPVQTAQHMA